MELQDLKNVWTEYDKRIDDRIKIDYDFLKKISLEKTRSLLIPHKLGAVIEIIINWLFLIPTVRFAINNISLIKFSVPAIVLALIIAATIAWNIYGLILLRMINYKSPVVAIQKKLETFKLRNLYRQQNLLYILYPLCQTLIIIIFCKAVINLNIYHYPYFLLLQFIIAIIIVPAIIWIAKLFPDKSIDTVIHFLKDLKKFEKED